MSEKTEIIEMILSEDDIVENGVYAVSIVSDPAIESNFIALKAHKSEENISDKNPQEIKFKTVNKDKRILVGLLMRPNIRILRSENGKPYYIFFTEDTIRRTSEVFLEKGYQNRGTIEHEVPITGASIVESWIVEDPEKDKIALYGIEAERGSWAISMKIKSDEIWNDYVKTGKVKGFSLEGFFRDGKRTSMNKDHLISNSMSKIKEKISDAFSALLKAIEGEEDTQKKAEKKAEELKLATVPLADGTAFEVEGDEIAVGSVAYVVIDGENVPLEAGEYPLEDGRVAVIDENSVVAEIREAQAPEVDTQETPATDLGTDATKKAKPQPKKVVESHTVETQFSKEDIEKLLEPLKTELARVSKEKDSEIAELKKQLSAMKEEPAVGNKRHHPGATEEKERDFSGYTRKELFAHRIAEVQSKN